MPHRSDGPENIVFALELLRRIPRNHKVTAPELHAQLAGLGIHRELRTVQRQLETLAKQFPIDRDDRSKPYGYKWKEQARGLSVPMLGEQESLLLALAELHLRALLPANLMKSMEGFFTQAKMNLGPHSNAAREREWLSKVRVVSTTQPLRPPKIQPGVFDEVSSALYTNRWLKVAYKAANGKSTDADVMPLGLAQQGFRLYLVCRYQGYDNERSLAMHRIIKAKASTITFDRPAEFDLQKYDDDGRFGYGNGKKIKLSFCISKQAGLHLLESPLSADQQVKESPDHYEIAATVVDTEQLEWWLRTFGDQVSNIRREAPGESE